MKDKRQDLVSRTVCTVLKDKLPHIPRRCSESPQSPRTFQENGLKLGRSIGQGAFAVVYRGTYLEDDVAVKILHPCTDDRHFCTATAPDLEQEIEQEANIIEQKRSNHIVRLLHYSTRKKWIVMEYCANGSLYDVIRNDALKHIVLNWKIRLRWMLHVALGMNVVHNEPPTVLHRDLKSSNIFLDGHFVAKVGDFGLSKQLRSGLNCTVSASLGNVRKIWQPLEVMNEGKYSTKSDVYSFGVVMHEVLLLKCPYGFNSCDDYIDWRVQNYVQSGGRLEVPEDRSSLPGRWLPCLEKYVDLMHQCTDKDPENRPEFGEISNRLRAIKCEYKRAIWREETKERLVGNNTLLKSCKSEEISKKDSHEHNMYLAFFIIGLLGLFLMLFLLACWCCRHGLKEWRSTVKMAKEIKRCVLSKPGQESSHSEITREDSSSQIMPTPFDIARIPDDVIYNTDDSSTVNLLIPEPEIWKQIREGFICELKGREDNFLNPVFCFCRDHSNDQLEQPEWEQLIQILSREVRVKETNTWNRYKEYLSITMHSTECSTSSLYLSPPSSDAGPSSAYHHRGRTNSSSNLGLSPRVHPSVTTAETSRMMILGSGNTTSSELKDPTLHTLSEVSSQREVSPAEERED
eukprot:g6736.t1